MRTALWRAAALFALLAALTEALPAAVRAQPAPQTPRLVVVVTRHGVRSPTHPDELAAYAAQAWPAWEVEAGYLTPHGAALMRQFGSYYRNFYVAEGLFPAAGCPEAGSVYIWADVDERTIATGQAIADGLAPGCSIAVDHATTHSDPLFDPVPALGKADPQAALASALGSVGYEPGALAGAYAGALATLEKVLGCKAGCTSLSAVPTTISADAKTGLASLNGGLDLAATAAENILLEYADGKPNPAWGRVNAATLQQIMQLHALKTRIEHENYYGARAEGSNILTAIDATLAQAVTGAQSDATKAPPSSRFVVFSGHDTTLALLAGLLHLSWLMQGYQMNDTPPGGALVFELYAPAGAAPFVRLFFVAQSLDQMRSGDGLNPGRVPVYIPGCPSLDCPLATLHDIVGRAVDPRFVAQSH
jgi:4-phytase / acid phosphatase